MLFLVITPTIGNAQISFDSLKEGAARAASAVGETTGSAVDAAGKVAGKATGALKETTGGGKTMSSVTDTLGRTITYTDASGLRAATKYDALGRAYEVTESDTLTGGLARTFTTTTSYDPVTGRQSAQSDTQGGTVTLGYDTAGNITTQSFGAAAAGGLKVTSRYDNTGTEVERVWTMTGLTDAVLSESAVENIHGQQVDHTLMPGGHRDYRYDGLGRLTSTVDLSAEQCTVRAYRFDPNSNRTGYTSTTSAATPDGNGDLVLCPTPTTPAATTTFDTGDRITTAGYSYDAFGRTTRLPLASGQVIRVGYHANDLVASQTLYKDAADADANSGAGQNPVSTSAYTLDLTGQRISTRTAQDVDPDTGATTTRTRTLRYATGGDSPDWTDEGDGTITRNITGPSGDLTALATIDKTGAAADALAWQISDIHGDVAATLPAAETAPLQISRPDEYGAGTDDTPRYGWLGAKQRAGDTPGGLLLMGVRLYNPETGRFLSTDPVYGGNANTYTYPTDPINMFDLDGNWGWLKKIGRLAWKYKYDIALTAAGFIPGLGAAVWAYRAYRIVRFARAARGMVGGVKATRATNWLAGRMWVGRGSRAMSNGAGRISRDGQRQWRNFSLKKQRHRVESNFESRTGAKGRWTNNYHVQRSPYRGAHRASKWWER